MQRFRFRLEPLLELRRYREREWELKMAEISGICLRLERRIDELNRERRKRFSERFQRTGTDPGMLRNYEIYLARLETEVSNLQTELAQRELDRDEVREQYLEVAKERKVLEKYRERKEETYYQDQLRIEAFGTEDSNAARESERGRTEYGST